MSKLPKRRAPYQPASRLLMVRNANESLFDLRRHAYNDLDTGAIRVAITVGELEGRPLDISGIAGSTGIARASVVRKVQRLEESGVVTVDQVGSRHVVTHVDGSDYQAWSKFLDSVISRILRITEEIRSIEAKS